MSKKKPSTPKAPVKKWDPQASGRAFIEAAAQHAARLERERSPRARATAAAVSESLAEIDALIRECKRVRELLYPLVGWSHNERARELPPHVARWNELAQAAWRGSHRDHNAAEELHSDFGARTELRDVANMLDFAVSRAFEAAVGYDAAAAEVGAEIIDLAAFRRARARRLA